MGGQIHSSSIDRAVAGLAGGQHGVVARRQLRALGIGARAIEWRLEHARLHPVHRGVYAVGHRALTREGRWMAAVLAAGEGAVLSHRSAGALWGIVSWTGRHEVTAPRRRALPGLRVSEVPPDERGLAAGIPVTSVPRTLLDLAGVLAPERLARAADRADTRRLFDPLSLADLVARHPGRRGIAAARAVAGRDRVLETRSDLEDDFLAYLERHAIPLPATNVALSLGTERIVADCLWPDAALLVELDSRSWHDAREAFESDRRRDRRVAAVLGLRTVRVTSRQLRSDEVAQDLAALLRPNRR